MKFESFLTLQGGKDIDTIVHLTSVVQLYAMDFNDVLTTFLGLECVRLVDVYAGSESSRISSKISLCYKDQRKSYRFGKTWGWVINGRIFIYPFKK